METSVLTKKQIKQFTKRFSEGGSNYIIIAEARFDDECGNGHNSFALTGEVWRANTQGQKMGRDCESCGCIHDEIAKHFPELRKYIKWHLTSTDGPMHYVANTVYHASNRDCYGLKKGDPSGYKYAVQFGDNPIQHELRDDFYAFLKHEGPQFDFEVIGLEHKKDTYPFKPKYTFGGFGSEWHHCPFDTEMEALNFLKALQTCNLVFARIPTNWSEGKERELDAARSCAVWPEATDEELSVEPAELKEVLLARLPTLLEEFKAAMIELGFQW